MNRSIRFTRNISILTFLGLILFVYAYMPQDVKIWSDEIDSVTHFISKETFFYSSIIIFIAINLIFIAVSNLIDMLPVSTGSFLNTETFKAYMVGWMCGLGVMINLFFMAAISFLGFFNNADYYNVSNFSLFAYIGQFLIFIWILLFFFLLTKRK
jgi:hypothetical protein